MNETDKMFISTIKKATLNVGKYTVRPMDPMGLVEFLMEKAPFGHDLHIEDSGNW